MDLIYFSAHECINCSYNSDVDWFTVLACSLKHGHAHIHKVETIQTIVWGKNFLQRLKSLQQSNEFLGVIAPRTVYLNTIAHIMLLNSQGIC